MARRLRPPSFNNGPISLVISKSIPRYAKPVVNGTSDQNAVGDAGDSVPAGNEADTSSLPQQRGVGNDSPMETQGDSTVSQTVTFEDETRGEVLTFDRVDARIFDADAATNVGLAEFLSRPTLIATTAWNTGGFVAVEIDPWTLFLNNTQIKYKLNNFAWLRGNLKVKFVINSTPFYYGSMIAAYTPLPSQASVLNFTYAGAGIALSQRPHIWITPQSDAAGEMTLPFFWVNNMLNITVATEVALVGKIRFNEYAQLRSANGAALGNVYIKTYAWMEDAQLTGPTTKLALQSDEYVEGPISSVATSVAVWANYFDNIPVIGRFARATSIGAGALAGIARLFGWSNPPVIEAGALVYPAPFAGLGSAHISTPVTKICLDPKTELSVDPKIIGLNDTDELSIAYLVGIQSYLTTASWASTGAIDDILFSSKVTPMLFLRENTGVGAATVDHHVPMSYVGNLFDSWRGDITFTFRIIASQYHRGKLRFAWDPVEVNSTTDSSHTNMTKIIDISEEKEFVMKIPYMQAQPWCANVSSAMNWSLTVNQTPSPGINNGALTVFVQSPLTAPINTAPVYVQVFVHGEPNLEFASPTTKVFDSSLLVPQADITGDMSTGGELVDRYLVNYGEAIPSLRPLIRRCSLFDRVFPFFGQTATDLVGSTTMRQARVPWSPGFDSAAWTQANKVVGGVAAGYNYCNLTPLAYVSEMFMAHRGSIRWYYDLLADDQVISMKVERRTDPLSSVSSDSEFAYTTQTAAGGGNINQAKYGSKWSTSYKSGPAGSALFNTRTNTGMAVEMPMTTRKKFYVSNIRSARLGQTFDDSINDSYSVNIVYQPEAGLKYASLDRYVGAGTDYNLHFFLNAPAVFLSTDKPVAS